MSELPNRKSSSAKDALFSRRILIVPLIMLFFFLIPSCIDSDDSEIESSTPNQSNYGDPYKVKIKEVSDSETQIAFGLIADTHIDMSNAMHEQPNTVRARNVARDINIDCDHADCLGVVHLGDMVDSNNTQYVVAFRQIFENDYPGADGGAIAGARDTDYEAYSNGAKINFPVFPTLGNHDDPPFSSGDKYWRKAQQYIGNRIVDAKHLRDHYKEVNYVWRWGQYVFIQLGKWAGSFESEEEGVHDVDKLRWLRNTLKKHVGNSGMGVFIFQHYGWDGFSTNGEWWNADEREMEIDILCRRRNSDDPCVPYNILGINSGHYHAPFHKQVNVGHDVNGLPVVFDNYSPPVSGAQHDNRYGFSLVKVDGEKLVMETKQLPNDWNTISKDISVGDPDKPDSFRYLIGTEINEAGEPLNWYPHDRPFTGDTELGGGTAVGDIDQNNIPDVVLVGIDSQPGAKRFYYRIGFNQNVENESRFESWSPIGYSPSIGTLTAGAGAELADIDQSGRPDLVLMYVDAPWGPDHFRYLIGWNLDASGTPERWSDLVVGPSAGSLTAGGGASIADIDGNGRPDLLVMGIDNPGGPNEFRYAVAWNLDKNGKPERWGEIAQGPALGNESQGGGASIADIDGNGSLDLMLMFVDSPKGPNEYRYVIGWNLGATGRPDRWSDVRHGSSPGYGCTGGGVKVYENGKGSQNLFLMALDDPIRYK